MGGGLLVDEAKVSVVENHSALSKWHQGTLQTYAQDFIVITEWIGGWISRIIDGIGVFEVSGSVADPEVLCSESFWPKQLEKRRAKSTKNGSLLTRPSIARSKTCWLQQLRWRVFRWRLGRHAGEPQAWTRPYLGAGPNDRPEESYERRQCNSIGSCGRAQARKPRPRPDCACNSVERCQNPVYHLIPLLCSLAVRIQLVRSCCELFYP